MNDQPQMIYTATTLEKALQYNDNKLIIPTDDSFPLIQDDGYVPGLLPNEYNGTIEQIPLLLRFELDGFDEPTQIGVENLVQVGFKEYSDPKYAKAVIDGFDSIEPEKSDTYSGRISVVPIDKITRNIEEKLDYLDRIASVNKKLNRFREKKGSMFLPNGELNPLSQKIDKEMQGISKGKDWNYIGSKFGYTFDEHNKIQEHKGIYRMFHDHHVKDMKELLGSNKVGLPERERKLMLEAIDMMESLSSPAKMLKKILSEDFLEEMIGRSSTVVMGPNDDMATEIERGIQQGVINPNKPIPMGVTDITKAPPRDYEFELMYKPNGGKSVFMYSGGRFYASELPSALAHDGADTRLIGELAKKIQNL